MWHIATTDDFDQWFSDLDQDAQVEIIAKVNLLRTLGPKLSRPHADTLNGSKHANMKELRADTSDKVMRIAFALMLNGVGSCFAPVTNRERVQRDFISN